MSAPAILFVCLGNICRSPTAEGVLAHKAKKLGLDIKTDSAGTAGYHDGAMPDKRAQEVANARGYDLSRLKCRKVMEGDFVNYDYILGMDEANVRDLKRKCPQEYQHKIQLFLDFASVKSDDVPDPYYGGKKAFELVLDLIEEGADGVLKKLSTQ